MKCCITRKAGEGSLCLLQKSFFVLIMCVAFLAIPQTGLSQVIIGDEGVLRIGPSGTSCQPAAEHVPEVYPNPFSDFIDIRFSCETDVEWLEIRPHYSGTISYTLVGPDVIRLEVEQLATGDYSLLLTTSEDDYVYHIVK
jgi:hypothetical protein